MPRMATSRRRSIQSTADLPGPGAARLPKPDARLTSGACSTTRPATPASASMCTGRSACRSARTAISTAMCGDEAHRRGALPRRVPARDRPHGGARARPHRHERLLRRRHAVADGAGDRRPRSSMPSPRRGRSRPTPRSRSRPTRRASRRRASRGYRAAGVNRVSLGVQALNDADLRRLGRLHTAAEALAAVEDRGGRASSASRSTSSTPGRTRRRPHGRRSSRRRSATPPSISRSTSSRSSPAPGSSACTPPASSSCRTTTPPARSTT